MTFEEAIKTMIKKYYEDDYEDSADGPKRFNKQYFNSMRDEYLTPKEISKDKKKGSEHADTIRHVE